MLSTEAASMADMWHYTSQGKQMEPVTEAELKRLASLGLLRPTDLVWKEGMPDWIRASSAKELFSADRISAGPTPRAEILEAIPVDDPPAAIPARPRRMRRRDRYDDDLFDDDDRPRRRRYRRDDAGMSGGKIALIVLGSILGVVILVAVLFSAVRSSHQAQMQVGQIRRPPVVFNQPPINPQPVNPRPVLPVDPNDHPPAIRGPLDVEAGGLVIDEELTDMDPNDFVTKKPCKVFEIRMMADNFYAVEVTAKDMTRSVVRVEDANFRPLIGGRNKAEVPAAALTFRPRKDGVYRVIVTTLDRLGSFTLKIRDN
jgi:hypothetical protein